jgi:2-oxoglutarate ferredoxin oxidoreductase subunit delta
MMMKATEERAERPQDAQITLDLGLCKACGICISLCPEHVYDRDDLGYPIVARSEDCVSCLLCELHCPDFALEVRRRPRKRPAAGPAGTPEGIAEASGDRVIAALAGASAAEGACEMHGEED